MAGTFSLSEPTIDPQTVEHPSGSHIAWRRPRWILWYPPLPPLVIPHPLSFPGGGCHLVNTKFFVAAHCVVVWAFVLRGIATCIPCTHGRIFCSLSLKWNLIAQPCFTPSLSRSRSPYIGSPLNTSYGGALSAVRAQCNYLGARPY